MTSLLPKVKPAVIVTLLIILVFGCSSHQVAVKDPVRYPSHFSYDTVKAKRFDTGKMWTFEHAPVKYWKETYDFEASEDWLNDVRMSALKFANWCTASFVSEDGLIMTNHHCVDFITSRFEEDGEDIAENGFYANTLSEEREVPDLKVTLLVFTEDVTDEVLEAFNSGKTDKEKEANKTVKIDELEKMFSEETGLQCRITSLYNGGKYSLYGYKSYNDIRAVYVNETDIGLWGGDPDNFTYPRYNADFAFFRAYDENGKPLKTDHFYKFSTEGAKLDEPLFVIGNPGSTNRLQTVAQLEYARDFQYRAASVRLEKYIDLLYELVKEVPERAKEFDERIVSAGNSAKVYTNTYKALVDPYLLARKRDFEKGFKEAVNSDPELKLKYAHIWKGIEKTREELRKIAPERYAYRLSRSTSPKYFNIAEELIELAMALQLPNEQRTPDYKMDNLDSTIASIFPEDFDYVVDYKKIRLHGEYITEMLGKDNPVVQNFTDGNKGDEIIEFVKSKSEILTPKSVIELANSGADAILNSNDPFIKFLLATDERLKELDQRAREIADTEEVLEEILGQALYAVYGTNIPPDATFTLRINDGMLKGFEYNGTIAPVKTTFYGMYDRYYSNDGKYPWNLPERWQNPGEEFDMSTTFNFVSTNDITGGSSGSAVINKNAEVVGIAFDGNIESIAGNIIYLPGINRMVSVASQGMLEILDNIADARRISNELRLGRIPEEYKKTEPVAESAETPVEETAKKIETNN